MHKIDALYSTRVTVQCVQTLSEHTKIIRSVSWSPNGSYLATCSRDKTAKVWDTRTWACVQTLSEPNGHTEEVYSVSWSPDESYLATGSGDAAKVWDTRTWTCLQTLNMPGKGRIGVVSVSWSPHGSYLAMGCRDKTAKVWDTRTWACVKILDTPLGHTDLIFSVSWSPDGSYLATGSLDDTAMVWDTRSWTCLQTLYLPEIYTHGVVSVSWSPDGSYLAMGYGDYTAKLWDTRTWECVRVLGTPLCGDHWIFSVTWSPDGSYLAMGSLDDTAMVWDTCTWTRVEMLLTAQGHTKGILSVSWSPDGSYLATGAIDNTAKVWDISALSVHKNVFVAYRKLQKNGTQQGELVRHLLAERLSLTSLGSFDPIHSLIDRRVNCETEIDSLNQNQKHKDFVLQSEAAVRAIKERNRVIRNLVKSQTELTLQSPELSAAIESRNEAEKKVMDLASDIDSQKTRLERIRELFTSLQVEADGMMNDCPRLVDESLIGLSDIHDIRTQAKHAVAASHKATHSAYHASKMVEKAMSVLITMLSEESIAIAEAEKAEEAARRLSQTAELLASKRAAAVIEGAVNELSLLTTTGETLSAKASSLEDVTRLREQWRLYSDEMNEASESHSDLLLEKQSFDLQYERERKEKKKKSEGQSSLENLHRKYKEKREEFDCELAKKQFQIVSLSEKLSSLEKSVRQDSPELFASQLRTDFNFGQTLNIDKDFYPLRFLKNDSVGGVEVQVMQMVANNSLVVVKSILLRDNNRKKEFEREVSSLHTLGALEGEPNSSPLVVPLLASWTEDMGVGMGVRGCIVLPYYQRGNISPFMERMKCSFVATDVKCVFLQILEALDYVHSKGICHGDVKPENILFAEGDGLRIVLADFGISRDIHNPLQTTVVLRATPQWAAPELLLRASSKPTPASDIYAVGRMLLEITEAVNNEDTLSLAQSLADADPSRRPSARSAMSHPFFTHTTCCVCKDKVTIDGALACPNGHGIGWNCCFGSYIRSAGDPGAILRSVDRNGVLICPECNEGYDLHAVALRGGPKEVFDDLFSLRVNAVKTRALNEGLAEQADRLQKEFDQILSEQDLDLRRAHMLRKTIVENVLNLKCPRCNTVFVDFEGCFALTCANNTCGANFCGWCLRDCGDGRNTHEHVKQCPHAIGRGVGSYHGDPQDFVEVHRRRMEARVNEIMRAESTEVQKHLKKLLEINLKDARINIYN